jgi:hypothetical protein
MNPKEVAGVPLEFNERFILFCISCHVILMKSATDPFSDSILARVAKTASFDHSCAYHQPHQVELIDNEKNTGFSLSRSQLWFNVPKRAVNLPGRTRRQ